MLKNLFLSTAVLLLSVTGYAQNACSTYYPFKEGVKFEMTNYNAKGKVTGSVKYELKDVTDDSAVLFNETFDKKGASVLSSEVKLICTGDGISIDFKSLISSAVLEQYEGMNMDIDISGKNINIPNNLSVGQSLPDAELLLSMSMASVNMKMTVKVINRKVIANEKITTPAGTFDCMVLSSDTEVNMGMKMKMTSKEWLSKEVGIIKSEEYDNKGKLLSKNILTKFED
jgi:hypothetical protein